MQTVRNPRAILANVLSAIRKIFPECSKIIVKMLTSKAGDTAQAIHTDFVSNALLPIKLELKSFHYSAIISFEPNTRLLIGSNRDEFQIPLHSMLFFRGDMLHAGAGYEFSYLHHHHLSL